MKTNTARLIRENEEQFLIEEEVQNVQVRYTKGSQRHREADRKVLQA